MSEECNMTEKDQEIHRVSAKEFKEFSRALIEEAQEESVMCGSETMRRETEEDLKNEEQRMIDEYYYSEYLSRGIVFRVRDRLLARLTEDGHSQAEILKERNVVFTIRASDRSFICEFKIEKFVEKHGEIIPILKTRKKTKTQKR